MDQLLEQRLPLIGRLQLQMSESTTQKKIRRCCGLFHVRSLSTCIAVIEILFLLCQGLISISYLVSPVNSHLIVSLAQLGAVILATVAVILLFIGVQRRNASLLMPHLLVQICFILLMFAVAILIFYAMVVGTSFHFKVTVVGAQVNITNSLLNSSPVHKVVGVSPFVSGLLLLVALACCFLAIVNVWSFLVILDCYQWLACDSKLKGSPVANLSPAHLRDNEKPVTVVHATDL